MNKSENETSKSATTTMGERSVGRLTHIPYDPRAVHIYTPEERAEFQKASRLANEALGIYGEPTMTPEELTALQREEGIDPKARIFNTELMRMRYGDDWEK